LGNITLGSQPAFNDSGIVDSNQFTLVENASVRSLSLYITSTAGGNMRMALYTDLSGHPGTLICESGDQVTVAGWNTVDIPVQTLSPGIYWIAFQVEPGTLIAYDIVSLGEQAWFYNTYGPFPATTASVSGGEWKFLYTIKADYCPVICGTPTDTFSVTPTISPTWSVSMTPTISVTPTYVGTCACPDMFGKSYISSGALGSIDGFVSANWWGISEDGNAASISVNLASDSASGNMRVALYSNSTGGSPGAPVNLLSESADTPVAPGWNTIAIPQVGLGAGQVYWVALQVSSSSITLTAETGSNSPPDLYYKLQPYGPFGSMTGATGAAISFDVQVNYCPVACAPTPPETFTVTPTLTAQVNTPTCTYTYTYTATNTAATQTPTLTPTAVISSPTFTVTRTSTPTFTPTYTWTCTGTYTVTQTLTITMTQTVTHTQTPSVNSPTATPSIIPSPAATTGVININNTKPYPNPCNTSGGITISYELTRDAKEMTFKLYTTSARLIRKHTESALILAGEKSMLISSGELANLSQGVYFYVMEGTADNGTKARSKIDKIIVLK
jgi:hypothetical protein